MWPNSQFPADLVTFTKKILHGKLYFLYSENTILQYSSRKKIPRGIFLSQEQNFLKNQEIQEVKKKGVTKRVIHTGEFLSNLLLVGKRDRRNHLVINLKISKLFYSISSIQNHGLQYGGLILQENGFLCKTEVSKRVKSFIN